MYLPPSLPRGSKHSCVRLILAENSGRRPSLLEGGALLDDPAQAVEEDGREGLPDRHQGVCLC